MNIELAIRNNVHWVQAVLGAHGIEGHLRDHFWSTAAALPPYYSNLVTRTAAIGVAPQLERIRALAVAPPSPSWSIKDSFALLDPDELEGVSLRRLFDASWYTIAPRGESAVPLPETEVRFHRVEGAGQLAQWEAAWQESSPAPGLRIFPPRLLADPGVGFFGAIRGSHRVGGFAMNLSDDAVGLSNVFLTDGSARVTFVRECARHLCALHPDRSLVGYGGRSELEGVAALEGQPLGPLRVWLAGGS